MRALWTGWRGRCGAVIPILHWGTDGKTQIHCTCAFPVKRAALLTCFQLHYLSPKTKNKKTDFVFQTFKKLIFAYNVLREKKLFFNITKESGHKRYNTKKNKVVSYKYCFYTLKVTKGMKLRNNRPLNIVPPAEIVTLAVRFLFVLRGTLGWKQT